MQTIIVLFIYVIFFNWLVTKISFIKNTNLNALWIIGLFSLKIIMGLLYAWFYFQPAYIANSDTLRYFELSKTETNILLHDPYNFFKDLFTFGYQTSGDIFLGNNSYWNDLKSNIIIKLLALCNVFTLTNYYANVVLFNFLFFFGPVAIYRILKQMFTINNSIIIFIVFFIPSFLFWCSGIHKDGLIYTCLGLIVFYFHKQLQQRRIIFSSFLIVMSCLILLFALRNFMAMLLLPALLVWTVANIYPALSKYFIIAIYVLGCVFFFASSTFIPRFNLPQYIISKQEEFKLLSGGSQIPVPPLKNDVVSFVQFLPNALDIAFFRPHITEIRNKSYVPAVTEIILLWSIAIISLFVKRHKHFSDEQMAYLFFSLCFSISFLLLAGYTVTFSGAIVRYRAVVLPFLFAPFILKLARQEIETKLNDT